MTIAPECMRRVIVVLVFLTLMASASAAIAAEVVVDNGGPGSGSTGTWIVSFAPNPYGANSVYANGAGANPPTYTWQAALPHAGAYDVYMWWTVYRDAAGVTNRSASAPVDIVHSGGTARGSVNQQQNGGRWNKLGTFTFGSSGAVKLFANGSSSTTFSADAVRFVYIDQSGGGSSFGFLDDFGADTIGTYTVAPASAQSGIGKFFYDDIGKRALVITGSNAGLQIARNVAPGMSGLFLADITPIGTYAAGGRLYIRLLQDQSNYYEIYNSDGFGPGYLRKVVNGQVVDSAPFQSGYTQYTWYPIKVRFSPASTTVEAFNQTVTISGNGAALAVDEFRIEAQQQDAYLDTFVVPATQSPFAFVAQPQSLYIQGGTTLTARAKAGSIPSGGGVKFVLDAGSPAARSVIDKTEPYEAVFSALSKKEYTLDVAVVDSTGASVPGAFTRDRELPIGVGAYYVAVGDSITFGEGDDDTADDTSGDERTTGGGFEPVVNDYLTEQRGYPNAVYNDGIPGARSVNGVAAIPGTLAGHPNAQYILVMYGTNDSKAGTPSGLGLKPGDPGYTASYKYSLQRIIWSVKNKKKVPVIAKVPPVWGDCASCTRYTNPQSAPRNALIREYNMVIDELAGENALSKRGPDFYAYFSGHPEEFADNYHPNGAGYRSMGLLWFNALFP